MRPKPFADLLKQWLADVNHPGVAQVRTCAEVGRHEQPMGVQVTFTDGWGAVLQLVRASPAGGDPAGVDVGAFGWDEGAYRGARQAATREAEAGKPAGRPRRPQAKVADLLALVMDAVKRADHPGVRSVEVSARAPGQREVLRVSCLDGSMIYGLPAGFVPPGSTEFGHPAHAIPRELVAT